jgi:hypothetical protein
LFEFIVRELLGRHSGIIAALVLCICAVLTTVVTVTDLIKDLSNEAKGLLTCHELNV